MNIGQIEWNLTSRVHRLNQFPNEGVDCYVKRDDELGSGISGSKLRKYASLMPILLNKGIRNLIIIAGPQSNNLLAALQMAREFNLSVTAFLIKPWTSVIQGNFKLSRLFLDEKDIIWVNRDQWAQVEYMAEEYLMRIQESGFVLKEGGCVTEALAGAMTLAEDVQRNEQSLGFTFQHIFVDAGTGFLAAALIKGLAQYHHQAKIHVLLLADNEEVFRSKLHYWTDSSPDNYDCFSPSTAKSFGSLNQTIKKEIWRLAREEGILADPIYSAKLFHEAREYIVNRSLKGRVLIIHSGGILSLPGFEI